MDFLGTPLGFLMNIIYKVIPNYGLAIIILSALIKALLLPLTIKQQKSMSAMQQVQPLLSEIQKKYANDKEKQSMETMKLYKQYNISPFAGCLPLLLQFPILIGLYAAIAKPLSFMMGIGGEAIAKLGTLVGIEAVGNPYAFEIAISKAASSVEFIERAQEIAPSFIPIDFNFLGFLDLSVQPSWTILSIAWILPILAAVLTWLSTRVMQPKQDNNGANEMQSATKMMNYMMPIMILVFAFQVPGGLSLYWAINSVLQIIQYYTLDTKMKTKLAAEIAVSNAAIEAKKSKKKGGK